MSFRKHQRKVDGRFGQKKEIKCYKCGAVIKLGDVYYSKLTKRRTFKNSVSHLCENCYERQYITV